MTPAKRWAEFAVRQSAMHLAGTSVAVLIATRIYDHSSVVASFLYRVSHMLVDLGGVDYHLGVPPYIMPS